MIKKYFFVLMSFFIFFSSVNYSDATIEEAINAARPDRSAPWHLFDKSSITFNEYYISATNLACGFRAFGYDSREAAIDAMLKALADQDPRYTKRNEKLREYIKNDYPEDISVEEYLNKIRNIQYELPFNANKSFLDNDNVVKKIDEPLNVPYTLINAFALLTHKNLYIYNVCSNEHKKVFLSHSFVNNNGRANEDLFLLCKGVHYNRLVPIGYQNTNARAQDAEDKYLAELRVRLTQEEESFQEFEASAMCQPDVMPAQIVVLNINNNNNNVLNVEERNSSIEEESDDEIIDDFSAKNIKDFVFGQKKTLLNCTIEQSCLAAYQQAKDVFDEENALFVHVQLYLKRNYVPNAFFVEDLVKKLDVLIKKKGSKSKTKKYRHYASIFKGQVYVKMNRLDDAWRIFADLNEKKNSYTKTYWLDMSEMILLHEYIPGGMEREEAVTLAWELFNKKVSLKTTHRSKNTASSIINDIVIVPSYYNSKASNKRREKVLSEVEERNRQRVTPLQNVLNQEISDDNQEVVRIDRSQNIPGKKRSHVTDLQHMANKRQCVGRDECVDTETLVLFDDNDRTIIDDNHHGALNEENSNGSGDDSMELDDSPCFSDFLNQVDENNLNNIELRKLILKGKYYCVIKNSNKAIACFQEVIKLCGEDHRSEYYVQALIGRGNARDPEGLRCYQEAEKIARDNGYKESLCRALIGRGNVRDPERLRCYQEAEKIARDNGYKELLCQALIGRGHARDPKKQQYEFYREAEKIARDNGYTALECEALIGRGNASDPNKQQYEFYREAEKIACENGYTELECQSLIGRGNARDPEGLRCYQEAEKIARDNGYTELECEALIGRGNARDPNKQQYEFYQEAEKIARDNGYKESLCRALIGRGNVRDPERLRCYQKAEKIARENGYTELECQALIGRGHARDPKKQQYEFYQEAEKIARENGYKESLCRALIGRGHARDSEGLRCYQEAEKIARENGYTELECQSLIGRGNARDPEGLRCYQEAEKIARENGYTELECQSLIGRGNARDSEGLRCYQEAEKIARENGYKELLCDALIGRGNARDPNGLKCYQDAEKIARENGYKELECQALIGRGNARDPEDLQCYQKAERIARENGYTELECQSLIGRGNARDPEGLRCYQEAEKIARENGYTELECQSLIGRGNARDPERLRCYQEAEKIARDNGYKESLCRALIGRGHARDPKKQQYEFYREAEKIARENGYTELECDALIGRGNARDPEGLRCYQKAEKIAYKNGYKKLNYDALMGMGNYYSYNKLNQDALYCYEDALQLNVSRSDNEKAQKAIDRVKGFLRRHS